MIKAIVFDCFGVLIADVLRTRAMSIQATNPEGAETIFGTLKQLDLGLISREQGMQQIATGINVPLEEVLAMTSGGEVRNSELIDMIPTFRRTYKIGLLSNVRGRKWLEERFLPGELDEKFDNVVASGDVGIVKPQPEIYHLMAQQLGVLPEECVMIDDLQSGFDGAIAAGMKAVHYHNNQQALADLQTILDNNAHV